MTDFKFYDFIKKNIEKVFCIIQFKLLSNPIRIGIDEDWH